MPSPPATHKNCAFCDKPILGADAKKKIPIHTVNLPDGKIAHKFCYDKNARETGTTER